VTTPAPNVTLSLWKGAAGNTTYCTVSYCAQIDFSASGLTPNTTYTVYYSTDCNTTTQASKDACLGGAPNAHRYQSGTYTTDSSGGFSANGRYFGYPSAGVWIEVDAFGKTWTSNTVQW
jgi:hypothetical protein